jgi:hypothetical protein
MTSTLRLKIADAARLPPNADFEGFLGRRRLGAWLWEIVGEADDLAFGCFCNRIVSALADRIVRRNLQFFDIGADHYRALVGGEVPVRRAEAIDVQIATVPHGLERLQLGTCLLSYELGGGRIRAVADRVIVGT